MVGAKARARSSAVRRSAESVSGASRPFGRIRAKASAKAVGCRSSIPGKISVGAVIGASSSTLRNERSCPMAAAAAMLAGLERGIASRSRKSSGRLCVRARESPPRGLSVEDRRATASCAGSDPDRLRPDCRHRGDRAVCRSRPGADGLIARSGLAVEMHGCLG